MIDLLIVSGSVDFIVASFECREDARLVFNHFECMSSCEIIIKNY